MGPPCSASLGQLAENEQCIPSILATLDGLGLRLDRAGERPYSDHRIRRILHVGEWGEQSPGAYSPEVIALESEDDETAQTAWSGYTDSRGSASCRAHSDWPD